MKIGFAALVRNACFTRLLLVVVTLSPASSYAETGLPDNQLINEVCRFVAEPPNSDLITNGQIKEFTTHQGWIDVNNDGKAKFIELKGDGMHGVEYSVAAAPNEEGFNLFDKVSNANTNDKYSDESYQGSMWWGTDNQDRQWLQYKGRTFLIILSDREGKIPQSLWYINPHYQAYTLCDFTSTPDSAKSFLDVSPEAKEYQWAGEVCKEAEAGAITSYIPIQKIRPPDENLGNWLFKEGFITADIGNTSEKKKLDFDLYSNPGGVGGCGKSFFVLDEDQDKIAKREANSLSALSKSLCAIQHVDFSGIRFGLCEKGDIPKRIFTYQGYTLFEIGSADANIKSSKELSHEIWLFNKDKAIHLCKGTYAIKTRYELVK